MEKIEIVKELHEIHHCNESWIRTPFLFNGEQKSCKLRVIRWIQNFNVFLWMCWFLELHIVLKSMICKSRGIDMYIYASAECAHMQEIRANYDTRTW